MKHSKNENPATLNPSCKNILLTAIKGLQPEQIAAITIAYEPVWAIGTGKTATPAEAQSMHAYIRGLLREQYPSFVANDIRIQYGGSVKPHNAQGTIVSTRH